MGQSCNIHLVWELRVAYTPRGFKALDESGQLIYVFLFLVAVIHFVHKKDLEQNVKKRAMFNFFFASFCLLPKNIAYTSIKMLQSKSHAKHSSNNYMVGNLILVIHSVAQVFLLGNQISAFFKDSGF